MSDTHSDSDDGSSTGQSAGPEPEVESGTAPTQVSPSAEAPLGAELLSAAVPSAEGLGGPGVEGFEGADASLEIESPGKIIRIGAMIKQLLEEVRNTSLDDASREQLGRIYESSILELKSALSPELGQELDTLSFDFSPEEPPTEAEVRLAQAQLVGWLEGLFHGIQATLVAQQMAARQQLEGVRGELPERAGAAHVPGPGYI
jgi:hypothetical protein